MAIATTPRCPLRDDLRTEAPRLRALARPLLLFAAGLALADLAVDRLLHAGLQRYFGMRGPTSVLCVGHSRTVLGIDRARLQTLSGRPTAKFAVNGANGADREAMVRFFLARHPEVKLVVYDVEASSFTSAELSSNSYRLLFPFIDQPDMRRYLAKEADAPVEVWLRRVIRTTRYDETTFWLAVRGWFSNDRNMKPGTIDVPRERRRIAQGKTRPVRIDPAAERAFRDTVAFVRARGVRLLLVDMPTADILNAVKAEARDRVRHVFRDLSAADPGIVYLDLSREYESRHELFYDAIHVNATGQARVTERVAEAVRRIMAQREEAAAR
jgi:hypothetical protein